MDKTICLHPYRKRKFFNGLAQLFNEPPPSIRYVEESRSTRYVEGVFQNSNEPQTAKCSLIDDSFLTKNNNILLQGTTSICSNEDGSANIQEESFDVVNFDRSRTSVDGPRVSRNSQSSLYDSLQDSMFFLPSELRQVNTCSDQLLLPDKENNLHKNDVSTVLIKVSSPRVVECIDYYDIDRMCENTPCWCYMDQAQCTIHQDPVRRPMLLFCLQVMDEFITSSISNPLHTRSGMWITEQCKLAQTVFAAMWEEDLLNQSNRKDIVLSDFMLQRVSIPGVSQAVWRIIQGYWDKYKQHYLHQQEIYFAESSTSVRTQQWEYIRQWLHVYGLKLSQVSRLVADSAKANENNGTLQLSDQQLTVISQGFPSLNAVKLGMEYLQRIAVRSAEEFRVSPRPCSIRRDVINQSDWKIAFRAIEVHLKNSSRSYQVFPCGSFSRGAAFGSVIDVLVALPDKGGEDYSRMVESGQALDELLSVLAGAKIVDESAQKVSPNRALAIITFKTSLLILDVKVYEKPRSWFALLYYTGPESFTRAFYTRLLQEPLEELESVTFEQIYTRATQVVGLERMKTVDSERHVFDLVEQEYLIPSQRF